ncbi:MAG: hypothetical protein ACI81T_003654 [Bacteroidia bacterium]|jgi:hypothetical protein
MLYSNSNYVLLALIVERVYGMSLPDFADSTIFKPLEMIHTFYSRNISEIIKNKAYPHYKSDTGFEQPRSLTHCIGAGGVISNPKDLAKWSMIFTNSSHKFTELAQFIIHQDTFLDGSVNYARGVFVEDYKGYKTVHHSGRGLGLRTQMISIPSEKLSVIVFVNSEHIGAVNLSYQILDLLLPSQKNGNTVETSEKANFLSTKLNLNQFVGNYQELNSDLGMAISAQNDTLMAKSSFGRNGVPLAPTSENTFERIGNSSVQHFFYPKNQHEWKRIVSFGGAKFYFEKVDLVDAKEVDLQNYVGQYHSQELDVNY